MLNMVTNCATVQPDENERLLRTLVELRGQHIGSATDSCRSYDELHTVGYLRQRDSFYKWILSLLPARRGQSLLDVSCGQGPLVHFALQAGLHALGLDISASAIAIASQQVAPALVSVANAEQLPYAANTFDYVTNIGSIEHYFSPHLAIREMARVLHPEGLALILLPNTFGLLGNVLHVWRTGDVFDDGQPLQRYGTYAQWLRLLELNGLCVAKTIGYEREWPRTWADLSWYMLRPYRFGRAVLASFIPTNLSSHLIYLCQKAYL
jgi:SAM-dependent methyltransferase